MRVKIILDLRRNARGRPCMVRLPCCTYDNDQTVLAHYRSASTGMGRKEHDFLGAWACADCHAVVDGAEIEGWSRQDIKTAFLEAILRTQSAILEEAGNNGECY